jgi:glycosyltransferase
MISIITPTFNNAQTIKDCIHSIISQNTKFEHIIIDGKSKDETIKIVNTYHYTYTAVSEPDYGIYDAMNKGIRFATGDIIGILNADDFYTDENVLEKVVDVFNKKNVESCYGDIQYVDYFNINNIKRHWKSGEFSSRCFYWGWMPPHPTFFVKRSVYEKYGKFNLDLGSAADYEIMLRFLVKYKITTAYIPEILVKMRTGGESNSSLKNRIKANRMDRKAWKVNGLKPYPWTTFLKPLRKVGQYFV